MGNGLNTVAEALATGMDALAEPAMFAVVSLFLSFVFAISAIPKIRRPELAAFAMADFGVLARPRRAAGLALGGVELALAGGLIVASASGSSIARIVPAAGATLLLWLFAGLIIRALRSGQSFECQCFGAGEQVSGRTLVRTTLLALLASATALAATRSSEAPESVGTVLLASVVAASVLGSMALLSKVNLIKEITA